MSEPKITIQDLYPELTPEEQKEAEDNLHNNNIESGIKLATAVDKSRKT